MYSCCSHYKGSCKGYYSILSTASSAIGITSSAAVRIASRISRGSYRDSYGYYCRYYYKGYCGGFYRGYYGGNIGLVNSWWLPLGL